MIQSTPKFKYSEMFFSAQGEGHYTGAPTVWLRFWGCNFSCRGWGQNHLPREQWIEPHQEVDPNKYNTLEELPIFSIGCDSAYSHNKNFRKFAKSGTAEEIANGLTELLPKGRFIHPQSEQPYHLAFTGGEPMLSQKGIVDILQVLKQHNNHPRFITIETNGTQEIRQNFLEYFLGLSKDWSDGIQKRVELFWSLSPKLYISGEKFEDAIRPEVVAKYYDLSEHGQLKYVINNSNRAWDEVERATELYRKEGIKFPVWIMPVGGTKGDQMKIQQDVATECLKRGYNFSPRLQCLIWDNAIGK